MIKILTSRNIGHARTLKMLKMCPIPALLGARWFWKTKRLFLLLFVWLFFFSQLVFVCVFSGQT